MLDLRDKERQEVLRIHRTHVPDYPVWAFGSRVQGTTNTYSALDLAVIALGSLSLASMADIKAAFDESDLVFKVEVVDWPTTSANLREIITRKKIVLQEGCPTADWVFESAVHDNDASR